MDIIVKYLPTILLGLAVVIPLVAALINYVTKAADSKNWNRGIVLRNASVRKNFSTDGFEVEII